MLSLLLVLGVTTAAQAAPAVSPLDDLDRAFVCPEAMASDRARMAALRAFFDRYAAARPAATVPDMLSYRRTLLAKHGCRRTVERLDAAERSDDADRQAWLPLDGHAGVALAMSATHVVPVLDRRFPEAKAVEAIARLTFAVPSVTSATHVRFDEVVSRAIYYCRTGRYALVKNEFFLAGRPVLTDAGEVVATVDGASLYRLQDVPPGSFTAEAAAWACAADKATIG